MSDSKSVMIVDDHEFVRRAVRAIVESTGKMQVCAEAADGTTAVNQAAHLKPDLIILDFVMPGGMNGLEASSAIKQLTPDSRILLFTLYSEKVAEKLAKAAGVEMVVAKEQGSAALITALRSLFPN